MLPILFLLLFKITPLISIVNSSSSSSSSSSLPSQVLFQTGWFKLDKRAKRQTFSDVTAINPDVIGRGNVTYVMARSRSIPVLHENAVYDLLLLKDLTLKKNKIELVRPGAFRNLPSLETLQLQDNKIEEIASGTFAPLENLIYLSLQRNAIVKIAGDSFSNMPKLARVKLNSNKLKVWNSDWFASCPNLSELYFRRNRISHLPRRAFRNLYGGSSAGGKLKIFLSKNRLGQLDRGSFDGMKSMGQLWLDRNGLRKVQDGLFRDLVRIDVIYLARNKIQTVGREAFPKIERIGILDLSANLLECVPYGVVSVSNLTNLERNPNITCACVEDFEGRVRQIGRHIAHDGICV